MSSTLPNYLTIEQCIELLPATFTQINKKAGRKPVYFSSMGNLYFRGSKDFGYPHKTWWYSINPKVVEEEQIAFIILAADTKGIFLIPSDKFFAYRNRHPVGAVKGGREDFTIIRNGDRYIRRESKCEEDDLTENFISK